MMVLKKILSLLTTILRLLTIQMMLTLLTIQTLHSENYVNEYFKDDVNNIEHDEY